MRSLGFNYSSVKVVVHHRGDAHHARAGSGEAAQLASSTNAGIYAAEAAARKFLGSAGDIALDLKQNGDGGHGIPSIYVARRIVL